MEYIWFGGPSGVGKTTLLENLLRPENGDLRRRFGITGPRFLAFGMRSSDDVTAEKLALARADHVLIHWRFRSHACIMELWDERPDCGHRAVILWRPLAVVDEDLRKRNPDWDIPIDCVASEWENLKMMFRKIDPARLPIEVVDISRPDYPSLPEWP